MLQRVAVHCSALQCIAVHFSVLQRSRDTTKQAQSPESSTEKALHHVVAAVADSLYAPISLLLRAVTFLLDPLCDMTRS